MGMRLCQAEPLGPRNPSLELDALTQHGLVARQLLDEVHHCFDAPLVWSRALRDGLALAPGGQGFRRAGPQPRLLPVQTPVMLLESTSSSLQCRQWLGLGVRS